MSGFGAVGFIAGGRLPMQTPLTSTSSSPGLAWTSTAARTVNSSSDFAGTIISPVPLTGAALIPSYPCMRSGWAGFMACFLRSSLLDDATIMPIPDVVELA